MKLMRCGLLSAILVTLFSAAHADDAVAPAASEPGIWQKHSYTLQYMGFTSTYSCDGLADKLRLLVKAAGARNDVKASPGACSLGFGRPDKLASASVTFYTLKPAAQAAGEEAGGEKATGTWKTVTLTDRKPRDLARGDCELVEQFRDNLLPMFTTRAVDSRITCIPNQLSGSSFNLQFEAFQPLTQKKPDPH